MFQMFGFGGVKCPRCEHKNAAASGYCAQCGVILGAPRNEPVLRENRWQPAADELAVFFGVRELSGIFTKTLRVPVASRAYILQGQQATEVPQGEYEIEGFFSRLNHLLRDGHAEILITRMAALPVEFEFADLASAEHLQISARFTVSVKIEQVSAFAQHFMTAPGSVTSAQVRDLLAPSVRQIAAEFVGARSLRDMAGNPDLRVQLDERLQAALRMRLAQYGLAVVQVDTLALRHDKFDANRARLGTLWLVVDERHAQLEHVKQLDQLYDEQEWQAIWREEQAMQLASRRAQLRQDATIDKAELAQQEGERAQAIRARRVDLYGRIMESQSRQQALERGAGATLAELEHELEHDLARRDAQRADAAGEWQHVRALASIKMRTELELSQQAGREQMQLAQQRFSHQLHLQQIDNQIAQAVAIEDEAARRAQLTRLRQSQAESAQREAQMEREQHQARWQGAAIENAARKREAERVQEWQDQLQLNQQRDLLRADKVKEGAAQTEAAQVRENIAALQRAGAQSDAIAQHEKLLRTIEADAIQARQIQKNLHQAGLDQLDLDEQRQILTQQEQESQWQRQLQALAHAREQDYARWKGEYDMLTARQAHGAALARIEIERIATIGQLSDTGKVALAEAPNALALAQIMRTQVQAGMSAEQIHALAAVAAAENSIAPLDAIRMAHERVLEERAHMEAQADKDRRHQLDLIALQNQAHSHALSAQAQLGVGVAQAGATVHHHHGAACCANGHAARPGHANDKFCAECGAPMPGR
ncbi:ribosomal protein L37E [Oxalobacteraceae bacterium GrIS 1.11]